MKYIIFDLDGTLSRTDKFMIPSIELAIYQFGQKMLFAAR